MSRKIHECFPWNPICIIWRVKIERFNERIIPTVMSYRWRRADPFHAASFYHELIRYFCLTKYIFLPKKKKLQICLRNAITCPSVGTINLSIFFYGWRNAHAHSHANRKTPFLYFEDLTLRFAVTSNTALSKYVHILRKTTVPKVRR